MNKILAPVLSVTLLLSSTGALSQNASVQDQLTYLAAKINSQLPAKQGPATLNRVEVGPSVLVFRLSLPNRLRGQYANLNIVDDFRNNVCKTELVQLVQAGATIRLHAERSGADPVIYDVNEGACNMAAAGAVADRPDFSALRSLAEDALRSRLVDPASAQFTFPNAFARGTWKPLLKPRVSGWITCGTVNAKNRMGGYNGASAFIVVIENGSVEYLDMDSGSDTYRLVASACQKSAGLFAGQ